MNPITIPRNITKQGDLVVVPRKEYEELLHFREGKEKKQSTSEWDIEEGIRDIRAGRVFGPFGSVADFQATVKKYETSS